MSVQDTKITYYVTKYALTEGIIVVKPGQGSLDDIDGKYLYYGGNAIGPYRPSLGVQVKDTDFFASLDDAKLRVAQLVEKKLRTLDRQIRKLQNYNPVVKEVQ